MGLNILVIKLETTLWETARPRGRDSIVKAIQDIRRYLNDHSGTPSAEVLARLPATLSKEEELPLSELYQLDWETFELAIELLRDWRIDRYYAGKDDLVSASATTDRARDTAVAAE